ncbi:NmrA-like family-domain-containing protein [Massariosphaeria phaeospora]|uniref:NmrA-like family-domain-containing protein n=1 Tax=Massariosphaeria phaeospora TaxID=100035 RepID=A0A7C8M941_9PLEO|nr:NmrA-like family-domain-containing protein [Massariosphaeria phaeospora]
MSHNYSYGIVPPFNTVALFGADGQIGERILSALLTSKRHTFKVIAFIPPSGQLPGGTDTTNVVTKTFDLGKLTREDLASNLKGVDAVVSALNGEALIAQGTIQDAAADAGVQRFYPSEYGMHNIYRKPGDPQGYVHPAWNMKAEMNEQAIIHPAVRAGRMSFTMIGCGDFYDQYREKVWCPWTQSPDQVEEYTIHTIGDPNAQADYTHLDDFAAFLVATLLEPEKSKDQFLNVVSDTISHNEIAKLLKKYTGKDVKMDIRPNKDMHKVIADPSSVKEEGLKQSAFPVDFWFLVKGLQGQGRFVRPASQIHNERFGLTRTSFEAYFKHRSPAAKETKL